MNLPPQEYLLKTFRYEPESGILYWRERSDQRPQWNAKYAGKEAGTRNYKGRICLHLAGRVVKAHRVIWKMVYGTEPDLIDHRDMDGKNNKLVNLRECTKAQNGQNCRGRSSSGFKGVSFHKGMGQWRARLKVNGKEKVIGYFRTPEEAHAAYITYAPRYFGEFARVA